MAFFEYQAKDIEGKIVNDTIEADDQAAALAILSNKGYLITSINEKKEEAQVLEADLNLLNRRVSAESISTFLIQLSIMIKCGVSLAEALQSLEHGETNPTFKACLEDLRSRVYNGASFSEALSHHLDIFDKFTVAMVRVGETKSSFKRSNNWCFSLSMCTSFSSFNCIDSSYGICRTKICRFVF